MNKEQELIVCSYCRQVYRWKCICWYVNGRSKAAIEYRKNLKGDG